MQKPSLRTIAREWAWLGVIGFGGPPAHVRLLHDLCVTRNKWIEEREFEDAIAVTNLLPGPASTQLSIWCAARLAGLRGGIVGGLGFVLPGLLLIVVLSTVFLADDPPSWIRGAGAGAASAVAAIAVSAGWMLVPSSYTAAKSGGRTARWVAYGLLGFVSAALLGAWVVLTLLICGAAELLLRRALRGDVALGIQLGGVLLAKAAVGAGTFAAVAWTAFKVGALSYGGGFVIIPLMESDAVRNFHWMSASEFATAVALGQVTPGPVTHTVAVVGFAAAGIAGAALAAVLAFTPSFLMVLGGRRHFDRVRSNTDARAFLDGAGPAAVGAILGSAVPLALALSEPWQYAVLAASGLALLLLRLGVLPVVLGAGAVGVVVALAT